MAKSQELKKDTLWTKAFVLLLLSSLLTMFGFQVLTPTLPMFVSLQAGSSSDVGLVIGVLTIAAVIIRPFSGAASDTVGRKLVLAVGVLICLAAMALYFWASTVSSILLVRIVHGIGWGIATTAFGTLASDMVPASRRGEGIGYFGFSALIAGALGPLIGIELMNSFRFQAVLVFSAASTFISLVVLWLIKVPPFEQSEASSQSTPMMVRLIEKTSLFPSLLMGLLGLVYGGIVTFITLFGTEAGIKNVGLFFLINAVSSFLIRPISGILFDQKGHIYVMLPGTVIALTGVLCLSFATSTGLLSLAAVCFGLGVGAIQPSLQAWVINRAAPNRRGAANSTFFSAFDLGISGGAIILGGVAKAFNYAVMYRFSSVFLLLFVVVYLVYIIKCKATARRTPHEAK